MYAVEFRDAMGANRSIASGISLLYECSLIAYVDGSHGKKLYVLPK